MKDWRYEIKFTIHPEASMQLPYVLDRHPAGFYRPYPDRTVNNIYLDTLDAQACRENLDGISDRRKYRIRWYGDPQLVKKPILELKIKHNALGRKEYFPLKEGGDIRMLIERVRMVTPSAGKLFPLLHNSYRRSYFLSFDNKYRLTVDRKIRYQAAQDFLMGNNLIIEDERVILEVKFEAEDLPHSKDITAYLPYRVTKHSKYATGVLACCSP